MSPRKSKTAPRKPKQHRFHKPPLTFAQILAWADAHHKRTGAWPNVNSGAVRELPSQTWRNIHWAMVKGYRGMPGGSSLLWLLAKHRDIKNAYYQPRLTVKQILRWADAHHQRTGRWPTTRSGPVHDAAGENWGRINGALFSGQRGLSPGSSLRRLLARQRGFRRNLTIKQILAWADAHRARTGKYPTVDAAEVHGVAGETWRAIDAALRRGLRGLSAGSSLAGLLDEHRGPQVRSRGRPPSFRRRGKAAAKKR
jgi:hypothetical protein